MTSRREVLAALQASTSSHAKLFVSLIADTNKKNDPLKTRSPGVQAKFGITQLDYPQISKKLSHFASIPSTTKLQQILLQELSGQEDDVSLYSPSSTPDADIAAAMTLISNLENPKFTTDGCIPGLSSPVLDEMHGNCKDNHPHMMAVDEVKVTVLPANQLVELQHCNEAFTYCTLFTGQVIWMLWPSTPQNIDVLSRTYSDIHKDPDPDASTKLANATTELDGGVAFVQNTGECVRVPPCSLMMALSTKMTVMTKISIVTVDSFVKGLQNIPLLEAWWKVEPDGEQKRVHFSAAVGTWIAKIQDGEFDDKLNLKKIVFPLPHDGPLMRLTQAWDDIKHNVCGLIDKEAGEEVKRRWQQMLRKTVGNRCLLCGKSIPRNKGNGAKQHLEKEHWVTAPAVDAMEIDG